MKTYRGMAAYGHQWRGAWHINEVAYQQHQSGATA